MKKFIWFVGGIAAGLFAAKQLRENPQAQELVDDATKRAKEFGAAVSEGFREREAEIAKQAKPASKSPAKPASKPAPKKRVVAKRAPAKKAPASKPVNKPSAN
jgi:hypothetical protein